MAMDVPMAGGLAAKRGGGLPKLRELLRRQRRDSDGQSDTPDLDFDYNNAHKYTSEIAELYSYTEEPEFSHGQKCFEEDFHSYVDQKWSQLDTTRQMMHILRLQNSLECAKREQRMKTARAVLYLAQGVFSECSSEEDQVKWCRHNCLLLYRCGIFTTFVELLCMEAENSVAASTALRKPAVSIIDSNDLRVVLSVLYIMVETLRTEQSSDTEEMKADIKTFQAEVGQPIKDEDSLSVILFNMVTKFCSGHAPHFPIKKILLLLWKTILFSLGGLAEYSEMKQVARKAAHLPAVREDTMTVAKTMRASSPPMAGAEVFDPQRRSSRQNRRVIRYRMTLSTKQKEFRYRTTLTTNLKVGQMQKDTNNKTKGKSDTE